MPTPASVRPLADRLRPSRLADLIGQDHLTAPDAVLRKMIEGDELCSLILWGPPGCGKTTLAHIMAQRKGYDFVSLSAVTSGIKEVKELIEGARRNLEDFKKRTILFIDEIHRFNKAQQDAFLPHVENGTIILVGATTENPSFSLIAPLLSRCRVFTLKPLTPDALRAILDRAVRDEKEGFGKEKLEIEEGFLDAIVALADSDARRGLNSLELLVRLKRG
ncbi:MAG: AAA family ATPase, partial [bacterium]